MPVDRLYPPCTLAGMPRAPRAALAFHGAGRHRTAPSARELTRRAYCDRHLAAKKPPARRCEPSGRVLTEKSRLMKRGQRMDHTRSCTVGGAS